MIIFKLKFFKAYNKINYDFMFECMSQLGILTKFITMIQLFFIRVKAKVNINKFFFEDLEIKLGVW